MKKQLILSSAFLFLFSLIAKAQFEIEETLPTGPTTALQFDEPEHHFGTARAGEKVQHIYRFTNIGNEPLQLTNAKGSCGCTVSNWPKDPIKPGGTGAIVVEFDTKGKSGPQVKQVTIMANTDPMHTILYIKGEVLADEMDMVNDEPVPQPKAKQYWPVKTPAYSASVFPNPTSGKFTLNVLEANGQNASLEVYNNQGQVVSKADVANWEGSLDLNAADFADGNYWLSVKMGDTERFSLPFVVVR